MQKGVVDRTSWLSSASKLALISAVAICLFISPFLISISSGSSSVSINSTRFSPDVHHHTLTSPNVQDYGVFGDTVAVSGKTVVVGAPDESASGYDYAGHAYAFNAETGKLISTLTSPNAQTAGEFGNAVAMSGNTLVVAAWGETASGYSFAGHVYIFSAKSGKLISTLTSPNAQTDGFFGNSVAVSGDIVVVGAYAETAFGYQAAGHAYIFNAKTGKLDSTLTSPSAQSSGDFGYSVSASDDIALIGAIGETVSGYSFAGHAYTFNTKTGKLINTLSSPNAQTSGFFGNSVAVSASTVVVGAPYETASGYSEAGHAYTFDAKTGSLISNFTSPNAQTDGYFGSSVAVSGKILVVGAPAETASGYTEAGHAYTFNDATEKLISTLTSLNVQDGGYFGWSAAVSGKIVLVGAPEETASGYYVAGHAYIF